MINRLRRQYTEMGGEREGERKGKERERENEMDVRRGPIRIVLGARSAPRTVARVDWLSGE